MGEVDSGLSLACALTVFITSSLSLVILNVIQTLTLGKLFSLVVWVKSLVCALPLALSIFILVPLLRGRSHPCRTRLAILSLFTAHPLQLLTFCVAGMLMHYLLPILNPILEFDIQQLSIKLYLIFSGLFSGIYFYFELVKEDRSMLKFSAHRTTRLQKFKISLVPTLKESAEAALYAFKAFFPMWVVFSFLLGISLWPLLGVRVHLKIGLMFFLTQSMFRICLCLTGLIATNPRIYKIDSSIEGEDSLISLLSSKNEIDKLSAYQDLAILTRYRDPRRCQLFQLSIPGGKPKVWRAVWTQCYKTLEAFNSNMENINVSKGGAKVMSTPVQKRNIANETIFSTPTVGTPRAQLFTSPSRSFLWSKTSGQTSPGRSATMTITQPKSHFLNEKKKDAALSERLALWADSLKDNLNQKIIDTAKNMANAFFEIRPISYWLEERPDFKAVSILTDLNAVRLAMIAVSNTLACAPTEDKAGVTLECLPKALKIFTKMGRNMDMLVRNNNQRVELRKLRNECRTALGKIQTAYGDKLEELNLGKRQ